MAEVARHSNALAANHLSKQADAFGPSALPKDGIVLLNGQGLITEINERARRLLRCKLPSLDRLDFWDVVPEDIADQYQSATEKELTSDGQHAFVAHNKFEGSWVEYTFRQHPGGCVVNLRDVASNQKLQGFLEDSERSNQLIFEVNPNVMWIFDVVSLHIIAVNSAAVRFYGIPRKKFLTLHLDALFPDGESNALLAALIPNQSAGNVHYDPQLCKQQKMDGQLVLVELAGARINWNDQQAVLVSLADVSERHFADRALRQENTELEKQLSKLQNELEITTRDMSSFTYALSNDLQVPLHSANGFATILNDRYSAALDEQGRHYVNRIQASIRQLAKLVDDLRILVQLPLLGEVEEKIDLALACSGVIENLRRRDPGRVVTFEMDAGLVLSADKHLLITALSCLLENAWKFTSKKSESWIKVGLHSGKSSNEIVLEVSDNGSGFDVAYIDKLFKVFQRLHSSADFVGNGLGLAIVKRVADRHGGRVWAKTNETGASFFISFPQDPSTTNSL